MNPLHPVALAGALVVGGLAAGPAFAATTAHATTLTLKTQHTTVTPKEKDTLTGTLKSGSKVLANETVKLEDRAYGAKKFTVVASKQTNSKGQTTWTVVPGSKAGSKEQYVLVFSGTKTYKASRSGEVTVKVA
ncbi:MAG: hypothetical protein ABR549_18365 [Mycobacteriales bacterium]